jgi:BASS family bile acid:Na+ symporter
MALLIVVTVAYLPLVLPLLLPGVEVAAGQIAVTLFGQMLVPLAIGLAVSARWEEAAGELQKPTAQVSNLSLVLLLVLMLGLNIDDVIGLFGSGALLATLILVAVAIASRYLLGGPGRKRARCWRWGPASGTWLRPSSSPAATSPISPTCSCSSRAPG